MGRDHLSQCFNLRCWQCRIFGRRRRGHCSSEGSVHKSNASKYGSVPILSRRRVQIRFRKLSVRKTNKVFEHSISFIHSTQPIPFKRLLSIIIPFLCRFSHGEDILYSDLKKYKEPDFSLLNRNRCPVLVKKSDNIWYKARVSSANFDAKTCSAKLEHSKEEVQCDFTDVLPIVEGIVFITKCRWIDDHRTCFIKYSFSTIFLLESSKDSSSDLEEASSDDNNDYEAMHRASLVEKSLLTPAPDQALGEWEKHTKVRENQMRWVTSTMQI